MQKYDELLVSLRKVIRAIDLHSKQLNKTSGLTGPQLLIMNEVAQTTASQQSYCSKRQLKSSNCDLLDRIENRELITRAQSNG